MGSGQGSLTAAGTFATSAKAVPLADVESAWTTPSDPRERIVFTP
ncbi:hypothetical protein [Amycolatopsis sp. NPDC050768]